MNRPYRPEAEVPPRPEVLKKIRILIEQGRGPKNTPEHRISALLSAIVLMGRNPGAKLDESELLDTAADVYKSNPAGDVLDALNADLTPEERKRTETDIRSLIRSEEQRLEEQRAEKAADDSRLPREKGAGPMITEGAPPCRK